MVHFHMESFTRASCQKVLAPERMSRREAGPFCWHRTEGSAGTLPPDGRRGVTLCRKRNLRTTARERLRLWVDTARSRQKWFQLTG